MFHSRSNRTNSIDDEKEKRFQNFQEIESNIYCSASAKYVTLDLVPGAEGPDDYGDPCVCSQFTPPGENCCIDNKCLNFASLTECPLDACSPTCQNQRFQRREYAKLEVFDAGKKGKGLRSLQDIDQDQFIIEYIGEIIDTREKNARVHQESKGLPRMYLMMLKPGVFLDARYKGGISRFINHSCEPNCRVERWNAGGRIRCGIFADKSISIGTELTFDYKWILDEKREPTPCFCETPSCRKFIEVGCNTEDQTSESMDDLLDDFESIEMSRKSREIRRLKSGRRDVEDDIEFFQAKEHGRGVSDRGVFRVPREDEIVDGEKLITQRIKVFQSKIGGYVAGQVIKFNSETGLHTIQVDVPGQEDLVCKRLLGVCDVNVWLIWEPRENGPREGFIPKKNRAIESVSNQLLDKDEQSSEIKEDKFTVQKSEWFAKAASKVKQFEVHKEEVICKPIIGFARICALKEFEAEALKMNNGKLFKDLLEKNNCYGVLLQGPNQQRTSILLRGEIKMVESTVRSLPEICAEAVSNLHESEERVQEMEKEAKYSPEVIRKNCCMGYDWNSYTPKDFRDLPIQKVGIHTTDFYSSINNALKICRRIISQINMPIAAAVHTSILLIRYKVTHAKIFKIAANAELKGDAVTMQCGSNDYGVAIACALIALKCLPSRDAESGSSSSSSCNHAYITKLLEVGFEARFRGQKLVDIDKSEKKYYLDMIAQSEAKVFNVLRGDLLFEDPFKWINMEDQSFMSLKSKLLELIKESALRGLSLWLKYSVETIVRSAQILALADAFTSGQYVLLEGKNLVFEWSRSGGKTCKICALEMAYFLGQLSPKTLSNFNKKGNQLKQIISNATVNAERSYVTVSMPPRFLPFKAPVPPAISNPLVTPMVNLLVEASAYSAFSHKFRAADIGFYGPLLTKYISVINEDPASLKAVGCYITNEYAQSAGLDCVLKDFKKDGTESCIYEDKTEFGLISLVPISHIPHKFIEPGTLNTGIADESIRSLYALQDIHLKHQIGCRHPNLILPIDLVSNGFSPMQFHLLSEPKTKFTLEHILQRCKISYKHGTTEKDFSTLLPLNFLKHLICKLLSGLEAIHEAGYVMGELDPNQIFLDRSGNIKWGCLGFATISKNFYAASMLSTINFEMLKEPATHALPYMAPENVLGSAAYTQSSDMWAVGCLIVILTFGRPLFSGKTRSHQANHIFKVCGTPDIKSWPDGFFSASFEKMRPRDKNGVPLNCKCRLDRHISDQQNVSRQNQRDVDNLLCDLIKKLLVLSPGCRLKSSEATQHPYLQSSTKCSDIYQQMTTIEWRQVKKLLSGESETTSIPDDHTQYQELVQELSILVLDSVSESLDSKEQPIGLNALPEEHDVKMEDIRTEEKAVSRDCPELRRTETEEEPTVKAEILDQNEELAKQRDEKQASPVGPEESPHSITNDKCSNTFDREDASRGRTANSPRTYRTRSTEKVSLERLSPHPYRGRSKSKDPKSADSPQSTTNDFSRDCSIFRFDRKRRRDLPMSKSFSKTGNKGMQRFFMATVKGLGHKQDNSYRRSFHRRQGHRSAGGLKSNVNPSNYQKQFGRDTPNSLRPDVEKDERVSQGSFQSASRRLDSRDRRSRDRVYDSPDQRSTACDRRGSSWGRGGKRPNSRERWRSQKAEPKQRMQSNKRSRSREGWKEIGFKRRDRHFDRNQRQPHWNRGKGDDYSRRHLPQPQHQRQQQQQQRKYSASPSNRKLSKRVPREQQDSDDEERSQKRRR